MRPTSRPAPRLSRRCFLEGGAAGLLLAGLGPATLLRADASVLGPAHRKAMAESPLVYVTPLRSDGSESRCHAEVWFVAEGDDILVVTNPERWRAAAIQKGLDRARVWIGDHGVWKKSEGRFKRAPSLVVRGRIETDADAHGRALEKFGAKYADGWSKWGPRFRKGLADGSRVLIRYSPLS